VATEQPLQAHASHGRTVCPRQSTSTAHAIVHAIRHAIVHDAVHVRSTSRHTFTSVH
jgi:hypothetical protein